MKQINFKTAVEVKSLALAIDTLREDKRIQSEADKRIKAAKEVIRNTLLNERGLDIDALPEGETVIVTIGTERGLKLDRKGSDRIDIQSLRVALPDVAKQYSKRTVATYFEPLN